ncbi:MAG: hypothetical protein ACYC91_19815 [Solirubrobacteraceae bacterium]
MTQQDQPPGPYRQALNLDEYAELVGCPTDQLGSQGVVDRNRDGVPSVRLSYQDRNGSEIAARYVTQEAEGALCRSWRVDSSPALYNQRAIPSGERAGEIVLTTSEEDALRFATAGIPAVAIPASCSWDEAWSPLFASIGRIVLVGEVTAPEWTLISGISSRLALVQIDTPALGVLRRAGAEEFRRVWGRLSAAATPWMEFRRDALAPGAASLIHSPDVLAELRDDCARSGLAGDPRITELTYLVATSRLLRKPASLVVKGPSAAGKNRAVEEALRRLPESAYLTRTDMSAKALFFSGETFKHRTIVLLEAGKLKDTDLAAPLRQLLSEGQLIYEYTDFETRGTTVIVKDGPTNLITTTTLVHLDPELETRMLSDAVPDTPEQTRQVLLAHAQRYERPVDADLSLWQVFGEWLALGPVEVLLPFATTLAELIDPAAVRLRRDFPNVLALIESHALLHQHHRRQDETGRVIATIADYAAVHRLTATLIDEGAERAVKQTIRETRAAVFDIQFGGPGPHSEVHPVSIHKLAEKLGIDRSAARRRAYAAISAGYLENTAGPRRPMALNLGDALSEDKSVLPDPAALEAACTRTPTADEGQHECLVATPAVR